MEKSVEDRIAHLHRFVAFCAQRCFGHAPEGSRGIHARNYRQNRGAILAAVEAFEKRQLGVAKFWICQFSSGQIRDEILGIDFFDTIDEVMSERDWKLWAFLQKHLPWPAKPNKTTFRQIEQLQRKFEKSVA
jgi:hypothetical protein